jgi:hypothetical protein
MRRGFSILLILFIGLGPLTELLPASDDLSLPPCCRHHGAHHCAMAAMMAKMMVHMPPDPRPQVSVPLTCPSYPDPTAALTPPAPLMPSAVAAVHERHAHVYLPPAANAVKLFHPLPAHTDRGPPAASLS